LYPFFNHGQLRYGGTSFQLTTKDINTGEPVNTFTPPLLIKIFYDESTIDNIVEDSLALYYFNYENWEWEDIVTTCDEGEYIRNTNEYWFSVPVCHLSEFAVYGEEISSEELKIFLPMMIR
jgi:hypothetical protein